LCWGQQTALLRTCPCTAATSGGPIGPDRLWPRQAPEVGGRLRVGLGEAEERFHDQSRFRRLKKARRTVDLTDLCPDLRRSKDDCDAVVRIVNARQLGLDLLQDLGRFGRFPGL